MVWSKNIYNLEELGRTKFLVTFYVFHGSESISINSMIEYIQRNEQTKC